MAEKENAALYQKLAEELAEEIRYGVYTPGGRLPSIRDMAQKKQVSQSTMQKVYQMLERDGLIHRFSTWGYFVSKKDGGKTA